ncbi:MAG TPA: PsbP-related protein [Candidatus Portnoybacteria bacterium]|nr:PsbP-related protein [Candidatus Portnoybacteria bacterium]MDD5752061.1 PsbP-related protein [Candidatus Portnoybacteria bacterium]HNU96966.1 PsbP-related protein [Candidatus Portnoybacteria bacterium]HOZ16411.1 PsbP-related protein [Candidatus Portnoybacteria bacterium]HPH52039.1 PsbP-related protein [Candidatus Portnoybacteria bacterium]
MNKKTLIVSAILIVILIIIILVYFLILKPSAIDNGSGIPKKIIENKFFSVKLPEGWIEVEPVYGSIATVVKNQELINDTYAQKLNFRSYYSVLRDTVGDKTEQEYLEEIKNSLKKNFTDIMISDEEIKESNGAKIYFMESKLNEQNVDFTILLAVNIKDQDVWTISFNTLSEKWEEYKDIFYQIADSFERK